MVLSYNFGNVYEHELTRKLQNSKNIRKPSDIELQSIKSETMKTVRGTVQADILKEDQDKILAFFNRIFKGYGRYTTVFY